jgi:hypothetical protein
MTEKALKKEIRAQPTASIEKMKKTAPPLKHGDRLTRDEFERRYDAMPYVKKAELIEGVVYMSSPVRTVHSEPHGFGMIWLGAYRVATPGIQLLDNTTVYLDPDNEVQPDALLRINAELGGNSIINDKNYVEGAPELTVEGAASGADYDLQKN